LSKVLATQRTGRLGKIEFKSPDFLQSEEYQQAAEQGTYDLVIYDQCAPASMPRANTVFLGQLPPIPAWQGKPHSSANDDEAKQAADNEQSQSAPGDSSDQGAERKIDLPQILDWNRSHPLLANIELGDVGILTSLVLDVPLGGTRLIDAVQGPIAAIAPRDAYQDAVLGFDILRQDSDGSMSPNTNWFRRFSFPTFWLNTVEFLAGGDEDTKTSSVPPGKAVEIRVPGQVEELTVVDPADKEFNIRRAADELFQFHDTNRIGVYTVRDGDLPIERFAVNLFDRQESDIRVRPSQTEDGSTVRPAEIRIGNIDVAALGTAPARREYWKLVLFCALAVLVFEWYIYNRRVYL
jgi:hypothetical protein